MAWEYTTIPMEVSTPESGAEISRMGKEDLNSQMEPTTRGAGRIIACTAQEFLQIILVENGKGNIEKAFIKVASRLSWLNKKSNDIQYLCYAMSIFRFSLSSYSRRIVLQTKIPAEKWVKRRCSFLYRYIQSELSLSMQAVGVSALPPPSKASKCNILYFILLLILAAFISIFYFGATEVHEGNKHLLYDCFDLSPDHAKLLRQLKKNKLSILYGRKEEGLFNFVEHFGNQLSLAGHTVFVEDFGKENYEAYKIAQALKTKFDQLIGEAGQEEGEWIVTSKQGEIIPDELINQLREQYPKSKILIATTSRRQRNAGFKQFQYAAIQEHQIEESIERNLKVTENTADILFDYFETVDLLFEGLNIEQFSHQTFLGQNYKSLDELEKEDVRILKDLCKKGEGDSEKESPRLKQLGVIYYNGENYWKNVESRLNYELHKQLNCMNKIISQQILEMILEEEERRQEQQAQKLAALEEQGQKKKNSAGKKGKKKAKKSSQL